MVRGWLRRLILWVIVAFLALVLCTGGFIGLRCYGAADGRSDSPVAGVPTTIATYKRPEAFTYLTLPEWFIVYNTEEYARFIESASPSDFPYVASTAQYWGYYDSMCQITRAAYPFESGYHMMLGVIGVSFTVENFARALYENSIGRLTSWLGRDTDEDKFAAARAAEYGAFMHTTPWYQFDFGGSLRRLWTEVPMRGANPVRKWERRLALSAEYLGKSAYGWLIGTATQTAYAPEDLQVHVRVERASDALLRSAGAERVQPTPEGLVVRLPRYEAFTKAALILLDGGARFVDVAGNDVMLITVIAPSSIDEKATDVGDVVARRPIATDASRTRLALRVAIARIHEAIPALRAAGATIEHLYDY